MIFIEWEYKKASRFVSLKAYGNFLILWVEVYFSGFAISLSQSGSSSSNLSTILFCSASSGRGIVWLLIISLLITPCFWCSHGLLRPVQFLFFLIIFSVSLNSFVLFVLIFHNLPPMLLKVIISLPSYLFVGITGESTLLI